MKLKITCHLVFFSIYAKDNTIKIICKIKKLDWELHQARCQLTMSFLKQGNIILRFKYKENDQYDI
ncbi:hypothetical protein B1J93_04890 [Leptospira kirschneri serovar Pomona]|uniref:Uncharacterized protein n=1 Tax=Leptospira kirschneri serovar Pomona TaxID=561005 RepID=A0A1T1DX89_9LEPT|nr:hypothetical protein B1J93_04890 [Leptospira kirschneri serovar Pomona]